MGFVIQRIGASEMDGSSFGKAMRGAMLFLVGVGAVAAIVVWELLCWLIRHVRISWVS